MSIGISRTIIASATATVAASLMIAGCNGSISSTSGGGNGPTAGVSNPPGTQTPGVTGPGTVSSLPPGTVMTRTPACASAPLATGSAYLRRLTTWEYANTVEDILGVKATPDSLPDLLGTLPPDIRANGFSNDFGGQLVSLDHVTAYQQAADAVGVALTKAPGWLAGLATCTGTAAACRAEVVTALGLRLFRRPATAAESTAFGALFDAAVAGGATTTEGAATVVVRGMLQAPQFLYRLEAQQAAAGAAARALDGFEIASRLSYFLWASAPDAALLAAAQAGDLVVADKLHAQVTRMLSGPRARAVVQRYFREWLSLDDLDDANRGATFTPELAAAMKQETLDVVGTDLWDSKHPLLSMYTSKQTIVTPLLAKYYGLPAAGPDGHTATDSTLGRTGILTHASVLTINGDADASIVLRGLYVMRKVLCEDVPAPPPGATSVMLAPATASERQKSDARVAQQPCEACHSQFDPLAYAFEPFDNMGGIQQKDPNGNAVRGDGWLTVPGGAKVPYTGVDDYMAALAKDGRVSDCLANRMSEFAWGRTMTTGDACMLEDIGGRLGAPETRTFADVVTAIASSPYFLYTSVQ
jgi:Protein of unknown function (DUF1592)/Protein of unknown function (DUF1588)/Protein of unknown function (DUF1595)/Protein of unknown function (DUF1587)/Protein of unknown function (DUF1585)